jgi:drug/metabolite transporter (DMT)-like permease
MTRAFNAANAASVTPVKYFGAIYALLFGFFIFNETLSLYASIGIIFILVGVLLNTFFKNKRLKLKFR